MEGNNFYLIIRKYIIIQLIGELGIKLNIFIFLLKNKSKKKLKFWVKNIIKV